MSREDIQVSRQTTACNNEVTSDLLVCSDLLQNPLIVPVKVLRGSRVVDGLGVCAGKLGCMVVAGLPAFPLAGTLDVVFHPTQPWLFTAGADSIIRLYCN